MIGMKPLLAVLRHPVLRGVVSALVSLLPIWLRPQDNHPFVRALAPVLITYFLAAVGTVYMHPASAPTDPLLFPCGLYPAIGFMIFHAVFLYAGDERGRRVAKYCSPLVIYGWFGWPILVLACNTGWLTLGVAAVHIALARRAERTWVFVEYGATSLALLLLLVGFGGVQFPWGLAIVFLQSLVLTGLAVWGRKAHFDSFPSAASEAENRGNVADAVPASSRIAN